MATLATLLTYTNSNFIYDAYCKDYPKETGEAIKVNKYDRTYQVWKREPLSIELFSESVFLQKFDYIHENPVVAGLVT